MAFRQFRISPAQRSGLFLQRCASLVHVLRPPPLAAPLHCAALHCTLSIHQSSALACSFWRYLPNDGRRQSRENVVRRVCGARVDGGKCHDTAARCSAVQLEALGRWQRCPIGSALVACVGGLGVVWHRVASWIPELRFPTPKAMMDDGTAISPMFSVFRTNPWANSRPPPLAFPSRCSRPFLCAAVARARMSRQSRCQCRTSRTSTPHGGRSLLPPRCRGGARLSWVSCGQGAPHWSNSAANPSISYVFHVLVDSMGIEILPGNSFLSRHFDAPSLQTVWIFHFEQAEGSRRPMSPPPFPPTRSREKEIWDIGSVALSMCHQDLCHSHL